MTRPPLYVLISFLVMCLNLSLVYQIYKDRQAIDTVMQQRDRAFKQTEQMLRVNADMKRANDEMYTSYCSVFRSAITMTKLLNQAAADAYGPRWKPLTPQTMPEKCK